MQEKVSLSKYFLYELRNATIVWWISQNLVHISPQNKKHKIWTRFIIVIKIV